MARVSLAPVASWTRGEDQHTRQVTTGTRLPLEEGGIRRADLVDEPSGLLSKVDLGQKRYHAMPIAINCLVERDGVPLLSPALPISSRSPEIDTHRAGLARASQTVDPHGACLSRGTRSLDW